MMNSSYYTEPCRARKQRFPRREPTTFKADTIDKSIYDSLNQFAGLEEQYKTEINIPAPPQGLGELNRLIPIHIIHIIC